MRRKKLPAAEQSFVDRVRELEERLFPDFLDDDDRTFMKSDGHAFWHFRPSHHAATGLVTRDDIEYLSQPGRRLLSIGAHPAFFERTLVELGVPEDNILVTDIDDGLRDPAGPMDAAMFDMTGQWPAIGDFDRIIFPESLCIAISDCIRRSDVPAGTPHATDPLETTLLTGIVRQALCRLRTGGVIRANGPISHPNVVTAMSAAIRKEGFAHTVDYHRFFLSIEPRSMQALTCGSAADRRRRWAGR